MFYHDIFHSETDYQTMKLFFQALSYVTKAAPDFFQVEGKSSPEVLLHEHVLAWMKFTELHRILGSGLQNLSDRWASGKGPLAIYYSAEQVHHLIIAMFENTSNRDSVLSKIH